jgi:hypothetical protein
MGSGVVFALATLGCGAAHASAALDDTLDLRWNVARECPDRDAALESIAGFLPGGLPAAGAPIEVSVRIARGHDGRYRAEIAPHTDLGAERRRFDGERCDRVAEAAALMIAMLIDPVGATERVARESEVPLQPADRTAVSLGVRAAGDVGALPQPTIGAGATVGLQLGRAHAALDAMAWLPRLSEAQPSGGRAEIGLFSAGLRGCYDALLDTDEGLGFGPCLGLEAGVATGAGIDVLDPERVHGFWGAALAGMTVHQRVATSGLGSALALELVVPVIRPAFEIEGEGEIFRASPVVARASVTVFFGFR